MQCRMAHTPKRKPAAKPAPGPKLHGLRRPIPLTLPPELADEIEAIALAEDRPRGKVIEIACRQFVQSYGRKSAV